MRAPGRRDFVTISLGSLVSMTMGPGRAVAAAQEGPPALPAEQVSEFVRVTSRRRWERYPTWDIERLPECCWPAALGSTSSALR